MSNEDKSTSACILAIAVILIGIAVLFAAIEGLKSYGDAYKENPWEVIGYTFLIGVGCVILYWFLIQYLGKIFLKY